MATGPCTGTFAETGTLTIGPQTQVPVNVGGFNSSFNLNAGPILSFESTFTIVSGETTITGTKTLAAELFNQGVCGHFETMDATGTVLDTFANVSYNATIVTPTGTFADNGIAVARVDLLEQGCCTQSFLLENFATSEGVVRLSPAKVTGGGSVEGDPIFSLTGDLLSAPATILSPYGVDKATFGFMANDGTSPNGNLTYHDHETGDDIKGRIYRFCGHRARSLRAGYARAVHGQSDGQRGAPAGLRGNRR